MPRGKHKHKNGSLPGRGRGQPYHPGPASPPAGTSRGPRQLYPHPNAEIDLVIQQWEEQDVGVGGNRNGTRNPNRGNGPWRGGTPKSRSGAGTPSRGVDASRRGSSTPRGRGRGGRGRGLEPNGATPSRRPHLGVGSATKTKPMIGKDAPLTELLYSERPLLRPVKFVRATLTPFLFMDSEEVLQPVADVIAGTTEMADIPTANRVAQLFHKTVSVSDSDSESDERVEGILEEIDFADLARIRAEVDAIARGTMTLTLGARDTQDDIEEVDFADLAAIRAQVDAAQPQATSRNPVLEEVFTGIYNHVKDSSGTIYDSQQDESLSTPCTPGQYPIPRPSTEIANQSDHKSLSDTIAVEEEITLPSNKLLDVPSAELSQSNEHLSGPIALEEEVSFRSNELLDVRRAELSRFKEPLSDTIAMKEEAPFPSNELLDVPRAELSQSNEPLSDAIVVEEEVLLPSNVLLDAPTAGLSQSTAPEAHHVSILSNGLSPPPEHTSHPFFVIDTIPTYPLPHRSTSDVVLVDRTGHGETLGEDEERIVYVAPYPRSRCVSPTHRPVGLSQLTGGPTSSIRADEDAAARRDVLSPAALSLDPPQDDKKARRARKKKVRRRQRQGEHGQTGLGASGATESEVQLREEDAAEKRRSRRRGDSDLEWGSEDQDKDEDGVDALSDGLAGMTVDADLNVDAMYGFLQSMSEDGSRFMTMDDIEDEARLRQEDEEGEDGPNKSSDSELGDDESVEDDEEEAVFNMEEKIHIVESDDEALSPDSEDDELSPRSSFEARLRKVRERSAGPSAVVEKSDDEDEGVLRTRGADDEEFLAHIQDLLDQNSEILSGHDRKQKKVVFRNLHEGYVDDAEFTTPVRKKKGKEKQFTGHFAAELEAQWTKDRAKKAEWKREREKARLAAALDPLSGNGKVSRKAMRVAARLEPGKARSVTPHAIVDADALEEQIRRFVRTSRLSLAMPPMDKTSRKVVHELAALFGLKSVSKGKGRARYTTLFKTRQAGLDVIEDKVRAVVRRYGGGSRGAGGRRQIPRHKEGDEVGKEAPKIGEGNIGFRMLALMGWSEGDRIGGSSSVGIETPLTAVVKYSKLGLGATR